MCFNKIEDFEKEILLSAPWWGVKVPGGHKISLSVPAGQYLPRAQSKPGPAEPNKYIYND